MKSMMKSICARGALLFITGLLLLGIATRASFGQRTQRRPTPPPMAATTETQEKTEKPKEEKKTPPPPEEKTSHTKHSVHIGGQEIKYTATAGTMLLKLEDGTPRASIFYVAYTRDDISDSARRPITYTFNGGPGSASVWLHLGAFGPRRVQMGDVNNLLSPPYGLVENDQSLLDVTDLLFIDPVDTGYSRAVPGIAPREFHGLEEDVQSVGEFIRLWTTRNKRWASPKFLAGESYGTTRAAALSGFLQERYGMFLNGIVLISSILNFQTADFNTGNDMPYILFVPTYTAIAWYHKKLSPDLQADLLKAIDESRQFAAGEYTQALMAGDALPPAQRAEIAKKLARLTGLSADYIDHANLRIRINRFTKELRRADRLTVGRLDGRFTGNDLDAAGESTEYDPSYAAIQGPYTAMLNDYVRSELKFESDLAYEVLTGRVRPWSYASFENRYVNVAETLRSAMTQNPYLKVFVAKGYYDLATPFFAAEYTFNHLELEPALRSHISTDYYEAGHMMYVHPPSFAKLKQDIAQFIRSSIAK